MGCELTQSVYKNMEKLIIEGGNRLTGEIKITGFKNAALPILAGTVLAGDKCVLNNLPGIEDIECLKEIMKCIGAKIAVDPNGKTIVDTSKIDECKAPHELSSRIRASYYLLGAGLGRFKSVEISLPGGCNIGSRPIDLHIKGFEALGAKVEISHGIIRCSAKKLVGADIYMDMVSVGATINIMFAASMAEGTTIIRNAAKEPHIVDIANLINSMGGKVVGAGTDTIKILGVKKLHGAEHTVIPDQIEAGTYMVAAAGTGGDVTLKNVIPTHLEAITAKLREMDVEVLEFEDSLRVIGKENLKSINIKTLPYPGFPTDLQQPMTTLLTKASGTSIVNENMFEGRFKFVDELNRMGADIMVEGRTAVIQGAKDLSGAEVRATDLRAGAALIIAGLMANGTTVVNEPYHIYRGYENIEDKLISLGANIKKIESDQENLKSS